ncbi:MAG: helix-turn-helix transcriptional regulator [Oscillospiraceae bacterium]|nr:helix-turn-helix transcriptional regulator [Oscillospiraceae bacterium]
MIDNVTQSELILANAIRLLSGKNLLTARLDKSTFAIVFPLQKNEAVSQTAENMLIQTEVFIRKMQESSSITFFPEPYYVCGNIDSDPENSLSALWNQLESSQPKEKGFRGISNLKKIRHELHKAPELDWNLTDIAKRLNISRSYAQKLYKEHFGISFMDDIINTRIDMAKHLLSDTDLQINEIASACGYQNSTHFMRQFKEKVGMTPSKFRG